MRANPCLRTLAAATLITSIVFTAFTDGSQALAADLSHTTPTATYEVKTGSALNQSTSPLHYTAIEGANYYTVALRSDGSVWTWGRNLFGELGVSENIRYRHTSSPIRIPKLDNVIAISASGSGNNAAVKADGTVWEWGGGRVPTQVKGITNAKEVITDAYSSAALLRNGTVWSWKSSVYGSDVELARKPQVISSLTNIIQIAAWGQDLYAVKKDGSVWKWTESNQPGTSPSVPTKVKQLSQITSVARTETSLLALDKNGKVWRLDDTGQKTGYHHELDVKKIDANSGNILLLTIDGAVYTYGRTVTGKEGKINQLSNITDVSAGYSHSLALSTEGSLWGWGADKYQEAGAPATSSGGMVYKPVQAPLGTDVYLNGERFESMYGAVVTSQTVQLPAKEIATAIGARFDVHKTQGTIDSYTLNYKGRTITLYPNMTLAKLTYDEVTAVQQEEISLPEQINNYTGATTVPYEAFEALGLQVSWEATRGIMTIEDTENMNTNKQ